MHYTYVLFSGKDRRFYTGYSENLRERFRKHELGFVRPTAHRQPLKLVYYEACLSQEDARRRERFLKSGKGKRFLRNRLITFLSSLCVDTLERHDATD